MDKIHRRPFQQFKEHDQTILVETGTYMGDGVQDGIDAGFSKIISYEVARSLFEYSRNRFAEDDRVSIKHKPSQKMLEDIMEFPKERMFFWLDGHYSYVDTEYHETTCPVLQEIEAIAKHPVKTHTIAVDDVRLFGTREFAGVTLDEVVRAIKKINPAYTFGFVDGQFPKDILVARVAN